jgi:FSR family fosmidomycin resistance protein-like MFS transporter
MALGLGWRPLFIIFALLTVGILPFVWRTPGLNAAAWQDGDEPHLILGAFWKGVLAALRALRRTEVLRWLVLLQFADLMLDILHGYLALYFVDIAGMAPFQAAFAVAVWTGAGLLGDFILIPLLSHFPGLRYLRISALFVLFLFPAFLLVENWTLKIVLVGILGLLNAGWYAIPKGQLYTAMPGQSGTVMTLTNIFGFVSALIPLGIGWVAYHYGLHTAIWLIIFGPIALLIGSPQDKNSA